jgi:hypothetical protein
MKKHFTLTVALVITSGLLPRHVFAQNTVQEIVAFLVTNQAVDTRAPERDREAAELTRDAITRALLVNLTSVPIATSSSGFLYRLNPELGTVERATESFGGFFVERALAPGHGRASFGVSATTSGFDRLDDQPLGDGTLLTIANRFSDERSAFNTETLTLDVASSTMTVYGSVGIGDRFEIGGALPFVRLEIEGQRVNVYRGDTFLQASGSAVASGLADAAIRAKYTMVATRSVGAAVAAELRLPTGAEENLLGAGTAGLRVIGIASVERGPLLLSGNAGLVRGGVSDEYLFGGGAVAAVNPRLSISAEVLARHVAELRPIGLTTQPHPTIGGVETIRLAAGEPGRMVAGGIAGFKWNPGGTVVIGANVRWNFTTAGLTAPLTPALALEYGF